MATVSSGSLGQVPAHLLAAVSVYHDASLNTKLDMVGDSTRQRWELAAIQRHGLGPSSMPARFDYSCSLSHWQ